MLLIKYPAYGNTVTYHDSTGLQFTAVMSKTVSEEKIKAIQFYGGKCHLVETASMASR
jgi:cysteine synthase